MDRPHVFTHSLASEMALANQKHLKIQNTEIEKEV
jgi:hypothetical protein